MLNLNLLFRWKLERRGKGNDDAARSQSVELNNVDFHLVIFLFRFVIVVVELVLICFVFVVVVVVAGVQMLRSLYERAVIGAMNAKLKYFCFPRLSVWPKSPLRRSIQFIHPFGSSAVFTPAPTSIHRTHRFVCPVVCPSISQSSIYPSICPRSKYSTVRLSVCPFVRLSVCLSFVISSITETAKTLKKHQQH